jgi:hypothetical protein
MRARVSAVILAVLVSLGVSAASAGSASAVLLPVHLKVTTAKDGNLV